MSTATLIPASAPHQANLPVRSSDVTVIARWRIVVQGRTDAAFSLGMVDDQTVRRRALERWENEGGKLPCVACIPDHGRGRAGDSVAKT